MVERVPLRDAALSSPAAGRGAPLTRATQPLPVRVWIVDRHGTDREVDGEAIAWTPQSVHVRYIDNHGREGFVWAWASAVTRRPADS